MRPLNGNVEGKFDGDLYFSSGGGARMQRGCREDAGRMQGGRREVGSDVRHFYV